MATFEFVASNPRNEVKRGIVQAADEGQVEDALALEGYRLIVLKQKKAARRQSVTLQQLFPTFFGVKIGDIIAFTRGLSALLESGMSILQAMELLTRQTQHPTLQDILEQVVRDIANGRSLATALARHPKYFSPVYVRMVETAQETGALDKSLEDLAVYLEKQDSLRKKLSQTLMYPVISLVVSVFVVGMMFTVTLPQLITLFASFNAELPLPTRILIFMVETVQSYKLVLLGIVLVGGVGLFLYFRSAQGRRKLDRFLLQAPMVGRLVLAAELSRFLSSLGRLLQAGARLTEAVEMAIQAVANSHVREALGVANRELLNGRGLAAGLGDHPIFPRMLVYMVKMGEETGSLDQSALRLGGYYEREAEDRTKVVVTAIGPAVTLAMAAFVGFIAISFLMPIYSIIHTIGTEAGA